MLKFNYLAKDSDHQLSKLEMKHTPIFDAFNAFLVAILLSFLLCFAFSFSFYALAFLFFFFFLQEQNICSKKTKGNPQCETTIASRYALMVVGFECYVLKDSRLSSPDTLVVAFSSE